MEITKRRGLDFDNIRIVAPPDFWCGHGRFGQKSCWRLVSWL
jgi:hypothetical protein